MLGAVCWILRAAQSSSARVQPVLVYIRVGICLGLGFLTLESHRNAQGSCCWSSIIIYISLHPLFMGGPPIPNLGKYSLTEQVRDHQMATGLVQIL